MLIVALILGVPVAPALAALVFIGAFIPLVGAFVSGFVAVVVALVALGWVQALIMLAGIIVVMQIEGHVLQPFLLGRAVKLHPLAVLLAIAVGIIVGGIVGALMAVPAAGLHQVVHPVPGRGGRAGSGPAALAADPPTRLTMRLVGRERRRRPPCAGLLDRAAAGQGGLVLVCGEPGIGKRSLLADLIAYARTSGCGRAHRPGRSRQRTLPGGQRRAAAPGPCRSGPGDAGRFVPSGGALSRILPGWARPGPAEIGIDPVLLLGEGRAAAAARPSRRPVRVLVLEDLEDADPDTLALLDYLAPAVAELPVLLVGSQTEPPATAALDRLPATRLRPARLTDAETATLVDGLRRLPAAVRDAIVQRAEGLPLVAAALTESLPADAEPDRLPAVPDSYAALVAARLVRLDAAGRRLLAAAAVLGDTELPGAWCPRWPTWTTQRPRPATPGLVALGLLVAEAGSLRWPHPLVREAVWADLLPLERDRLNAPGGRPAAEPGQRRRGHCRGGSPGVGRRVRPGGRGAGAAGPPGAGPGRSAPRRGVAGPGGRAGAAGAGGPTAGRAADPDRAPGGGPRGRRTGPGSARHDEHADLCLRLAAAAVEAGQWDEGRGSGRPGRPA